MLPLVLQALFNDMLKYIDLNQILLMGVKL